MLKEQNGFGVLEALMITIVVAIIAFLGWFIFGKNDSNNQNLTQATRSSHSQNESSNSANCVYKPKKNFPENEGLYGIWRERAKKVDFDVYLPCKFHKDFNLHQLGINGGDNDEVVNVFLTFNRPEPHSGEDGLQDDSDFYIRKLPSQHQPPSQCLDTFSTTSINVRTDACTKVGDVSLGSVYKNNQGDLSLVINNSLIIWSSPPYDDSDDMKPMLDILNSLQKVDPKKLEFFNG